MSSFKEMQQAYDNACEPEHLECPVCDSVNCECDGSDYEENFDDFDAANDEDINAECVWDI